MFQNVLKMQSQFSRQIKLFAKSSHNKARQMHIFSINIYNEDINLPDYSCVTLAWTDGEIYSYKKFKAKLFTFCSLRQTQALSGTQHVQGKI